MAIYQNSSIKLFFRGESNLRIYYPLNFSWVDQQNRGRELSGFNSGGYSGIPYFFKSNIRFPSAVIKASSSASGTFLLSPVYNIIFNSWTIMAWAKCYSLVTDGGNNSNSIQVIVTHNHTDTGPFLSINFTDWTDDNLQTRDGKIRPFLRTKDRAGNYFKNVAESYILDYGVWYFLAGTYDANSGDFIVYVNGRIAKAKNIGGGRSWGGNYQVEIGGMDGNTIPYTYHLNGEVAEVAIFSRALSPAEISSYYKWAIGRKKYFLIRGYLFPTSSFLISGQTISQIKTQNSTTLSLSVSESHKLKTISSSSIQFLTTANSKREIPKQLIKDIKTEKINFDITNQP